MTAEHRFARTPDEAIWTGGAFAFPFWARYLEAFDAVRVVARVQDVTRVPGDWRRADGEGVSFERIPYYVGPWQYLWRAGEVQRAAHGAVHIDDAAVLRVSSHIAGLVRRSLRRTGHPYGVEVVSDPHEIFSPGAFRSIFRPYLRWRGYRGLQRTCAGACAAAYVTRAVLQRRYPPAPSAGRFHYSDVELPGSAFVAAPHAPCEYGGPGRLVFVGSLAQLYKAPHVLIDAVSLCIRHGLDLELTMVGDGRYRPELEAQAAALGLAGRVRFCGQLPSGSAVSEQLDRADLFVLPSYTEGLPRAMVEAMARGLPCIGSTAGGIPELLDPEDMVPPGDARTLARKIAEVLQDPHRMSSMSARNLDRARQYADENLRESRLAFLQYVRTVTEAWIAGREVGTATVQQRSAL